MNWVNDLNVYDKMTHKDGDRFRRDLSPGSVMWQNKELPSRYLWFTCACGCGRVGCIPVSTNPLQGEWKWDGNETEPTLTPSIFSTGWPCKWHGFLTSGTWRSV